MKYKYLFGPVPSRRLGMSLGIDLVPRKVCTLDCIYCECGRTTKLTVDRRQYIPYEKIIPELDHFFANNPDPDYITFSGSGEPTLNIKLGQILQYIKTIKPHLPVAVLTNGTLLSQKEVRAELLNADVVLPSLDGATNKSFREINRPNPSLNIEEYIQGLADFRREYQGQIWLEIFILPGINDSEAELHQLKKAFALIRPDRIQLNTLDRPGTVANLKPASYSLLKKIESHWNLENVEIISSVSERKKQKSYRTDIQDAILGTIDRRPCTVLDLASILGLHVNEVNKYLGVLENAGKIKTVSLERGVFYLLNT